MIGEWASNIGRRPEHCIVVIQTSENSSADAHFTLFEASVREGSDFARFHDTGNGLNTTVLKKLGKEIPKKCFRLRRMARKTTSAGPKREKIHLVNFLSNIRHQIMI